MKKVVFIVIILVATLLVSGCATMSSPFQYQSASAGRTGCQPNDITISNVERPGGLLIPSRSWVATCNGQEFICSGLWTSERGVHDVSCIKKSGGNSGSMEEQSKKKSSDSRKRRTTRK